MFNLRVHNVVTFLSTLATSYLSVYCIQYSNSSTVQLLIFPELSASACRSSKNTHRESSHPTQYSSVYGSVVRRRENVLVMIVRIYIPANCFFCCFFCCFFSSSHVRKAEVDPAPPLSDEDFWAAVATQQAKEGSSAPAWSQVGESVGGSGRGGGRGGRGVGGGGETLQCALCEDQTVGRWVTRCKGSGGSGTRQQQVCSVWVHPACAWQVR